MKVSPSPFFMADKPIWSMGNRVLKWSPSPAENGGISISMVFNVVDFCLPIIALIAYKELAFEQFEVEKQALSQGGSVANPYRTQVMVVVGTCKNLIVTLAIGGRKHHAHERNSGFIAKAQRVTATTFGADDEETPISSHGGRESKGGL